MFLMLLAMAFPFVGLALFYLLPWRSAFLLYLAGLLVSGVVHWVMAKTRQLPVVTGRQGMVGQEVPVVDGKGPRGRVRYHDELWSAVASEGVELAPGEIVRIAGMDGLTVVVESAGIEQRTRRGSSDAPPPASSEASQDLANQE